MNKTVFWLLVSVLSLAATATASGQELPDKPQPAGALYWVSAAAVAASYAADMKSTAYWIRNCPTCYEAGWFGHGERNLTKTGLLAAAWDVGTQLAAYEWKRHVRRGPLNKLWIAGPLENIVNHARAASWNYRNIPKAP